MKNIYSILVLLLFVFQGFANNDGLLVQARKFESNKDYKNAIKCYKKYVEENQNVKTFEMKTVYFEYANVCYKNGNEELALNVIRNGIRNCGIVEQDFIFNPTINKELADIAWVKLYDEYPLLHEKYLASK